MPEEKQTWNLKEVRDYINAREDIQPQEKVRLIDATNSIDRCVLIFRYHAHLINKELQAVFRDEDQPVYEPFLLILGMSKRQAAYEHTWIACEANFISAVHTVRNKYDIFSQLINGLVLNGKIPVEKCNIVKVKDELSASPLKTKLDELLQSKWFRYISALSNTAKHRSFIKGKPRIALTEDRFSLRMNPFEYKGEEFDDYWIEDALKEIVDVQNQIIECGNIFNAQLLELK